MERRSNQPVPQPSLNTRDHLHTATLNTNDKSGTLSSPINIPVVHDDMDKLYFTMTYRLSESLHATPPSCTPHSYASHSYTPHSYTPTRSTPPAYIPILIRQKGLYRS